MEKKMLKFSSIKAFFILGVMCCFCSCKKIRYVDTYQTCLSGHYEKQLVYYKTKIGQSDYCDVWKCDSSGLDSMIIYIYWLK